MTRKFFNSSIADLERTFASSGSDGDVLQALADELTHRSTDRAKALKRRVIQALATEEALLKPEKVVSPPTSSNASEPEVLPRPVPTPAPALGCQPAKPIANEAVDVLRAWTALEVGPCRISSSGSACGW